MYGKTKLAKDIAEIFKGEYLDLLDDFKNDAGKKNVIDIFGPSKFINYIEKYSRTKFLVVDQIDFLINTWDDNQLREFLVFVDQNQSELCCMFVMQNYRVFDRETPIKDNDKGHNRLINIYNIRQEGTINGQN